jgi:hypothetical protein
MWAIEISELFVVANPWCSSINLPSDVGTTKGDFWRMYFFITLFVESASNIIVKFDNLKKQKRILKIIKTIKIS